MSRVGFRKRKCPVCRIDPRVLLESESRMANLPLALSVLPERVHALDKLTSATISRGGQLDIETSFMDLLSQELDKTVCTEELGQVLPSAALRAAEAIKNLSSKLQEHTDGMLFLHVMLIW